MINSNNKVEILAPCGSYDILTAAVRAGADACYIGGNKFGARAYAANFDTESIIKAIDYAHVHDSRIYLTINTLFKNKEIDALYDYLLPLYTSGLDAVIVQDLGVFKYVREVFPDIHVHCSTQMNITSRYAAEFMHSIGASRVVTAREMSLDEIREIKENVDIEIETFVHGAMCYSYSGQCLMSSFAGGRSGNRGRCAQPCRKCYDGRYLLSMKDMCAVNLIPELIEAEIDSLKIEGRMKNAYYVASAVDVYKELCEDYYNGCFNTEKAERLKFRLANIYNRGGFADGYFYIHNGRNMISVERPNNQGIEAGRLVEVNRGSVRVKLVNDIYKGDVLEVKLKDGSIIELTSGIDGRKGDNVTLNAPKTRLIKERQTVLRTRCNKVLKEVEDELMSGNKHQLIINGSFRGKLGENMSLQLMREVLGRIVCVRAVSDSFIVEPSESASADREQIRNKLSQLGNTDYRFGRLEVDVDDNSFIPMGELKRLRRKAIEMLETETVSLFRREHTIGETIPVDVTLKKTVTDRLQEYKYIIGVSDLQQLKTVIGYGTAGGVHMSLKMYREADGKGIIDAMLRSGIRIYIELPYIVHNDFDFNKYLPKDRINGIYIRNIDGMAAYIKSVHSGFVFEDGFEIICGSSLYGYNDLARQLLHEIDSSVVLEMPKELNVHELSKLAYYPSMFTIYEHTQVMLSAQCIFKTENKCSNNNDKTMITDDRGNTFYAKSVCDECCNVILNGVPFLAPEQTFRDIADYGAFRYFNLNFTIEDEDAVRQIMDILSDSNNPEEFTKHCKSRDILYTGGHCYRGVD